MKDANWLEQMEKLEAIRLFTSLYVKKSRKGAITSAQEVDVLFRVALTGNSITPLDLSRGMGISKTMVSRLIESLYKKQLVNRVYNKTDKRSYCVSITESGIDELDNMYHYYLGPLYELEETLGKDDYNLLMDLIYRANSKRLYI